MLEDDKLLAKLADTTLATLSQVQNWTDLIAVVRNVATAVRAELHKDESFTALLKDEAPAEPTETTQQPNA